MSFLGCGVGNRWVRIDGKCKENQESIDVLILTFVLPSTALLGCYCLVLLCCRWFCCPNVINLRLKTKKMYDLKKKISQPVNNN